MTLSFSPDSLTTQIKQIYGYCEVMQHVGVQYDGFFLYVNFPLLTLLFQT